MITVGYCTVPEALLLFESHGKSLTHLTAAMLNGELRVYVQVPTEYDWEICRVPREDLHALSEEGWEKWLPNGRVPEPPDLAYEAAMKTWTFDSILPFPQRTPKPDVISRYERRRLLFSEQELGRWLGGGEAKTGAPGKPSSMHIVMAEFERRRATNKSEVSRTAEAKALAAWLKEQHPQAPACGHKAILNNLPPDFQPYNGLPK